MSTWEEVARAIAENKSFSCRGVVRGVVVEVDDNGGIVSTHSTSFIAPGCIYAVNSAQSGPNPPSSAFPQENGEDVPEEIHQNIFNCIRNNDKDKLLRCLDQADFLINKRMQATKTDAQGDYKEAVSALHVAAEEGHLEFAALLLDRGADINLMTNMGNTALTIASDMNRLDMVQYLLQNGADPNILDNTHDPEFGTRRDGYTARRHPNAGPRRHSHHKSCHPQSNCGVGSVSKGCAAKQRGVLCAARSNPKLCGIH